MTHPLPTWRKSSHSQNEGQCVEVAELAPATHYGIRDSKNPNAAVLTFPANEWQAFITDLATRD